jgi:peptide/nickel transport system permease protein
VTIGVVSAYFGGWVDLTLQRGVDIMLAFPGLLLALAVIAALGPSITNVMLAVGIGSTPFFARLVRGSVLTVREEEYVTAARVTGANDARIVGRYILPNVLSPIVVLISQQVGWAVLSAAALSFVGLGAQPPTPEWGAMLSRGRDYLHEQWWIATFPGVAIAVMVLGFNLFGDGLRDILDPRTVTTR